MRVALLTTFAASRKEPLVAMMDRVHEGFLDSGLSEPFIRFNFGDGLPVSFSSVDRVLKRHPELARFVTEAAPMPGITGARRISNGPMSAGSGDAVPYTTLQAIAAGVPRSFPFHSVMLHFYEPEFGELMSTGAYAAEMMAGVLIADSWWVNGRQRSLSACRVVEVEPGDKQLPVPKGPLATVLAACGKARKTIQAPLAGQLEPGPVPAVRLPTGVAVPSANPQLAVAVKAIAVKYRDRLPEIVKEVKLPHDLPGPAEMTKLSLGVNTGPKKPALERVFKAHGIHSPGRDWRIQLAPAHRGEQHAGTASRLRYLAPQSPGDVPGVGTGIQSDAYAAAYRKGRDRLTVLDRRCRTLGENRGQFGSVGSGVGTHLRSRD